MADNIILPPNSKAILLTMGKYTIVDEADYEWLSKWNWKFDPDGYAMRNALSAERNGRGHYNIRMHRVIMQAPRGLQVDHINGNSLDNRRCNMRLCTKTENGRNRKSVKGSTSPFKGVCFIKDKGRYQASIHVSHKSIYLGTYDDPVEAAKAYDMAALEHFGQFARLNFPAVLEAAGVKYVD